MADRTENSFIRYGLLPACVIAVIALLYGLKVAFDQAETTLETEIAADAGVGTPVRLADGSGFAGLGKIRIGHEDIAIERVDGTGQPVGRGDHVRENPHTFQVLERGANGTPVSAHPKGAHVRAQGTMFFPENNATYGKSVDDLFYIILWITGIAFVITEAFFLYSIIRFRGRASMRADYSHGNHKLELVWTVIPAVILVGLAIIQSSMWTEIKIAMPREGPGTEAVQVVARQFEWNFRHAGIDGRFGTADDIPELGELHVPTGKKVLLQLRSQDVIHSFFLPEFRLKQDVVPGMQIPAWFEALRPGTYQIMCAELCGNNHTTMRGRLIVQTPADYAAWLTTESEKWASENDGMDRADWYGSQARFWWWWDRYGLKAADWQRDPSASR